MPKVHFYADEAYPVFGFIEDSSWGPITEITEEELEEFRKAEEAYNLYQEKIEKYIVPR